MNFEIERFCKVLWHEPLAPYTTFKVGGQAEALALPGSLEELARLANFLTVQNIPWLVLGRGSNVLVNDQGVPGVVILMGDNLSELEVLEDDDKKVLIKVQAGCSLSRLLSWTVEKGLSGLEFTTGIPGSLGGGIVMNCGAWGETISDVLISVKVMREDGSFSDLPEEKLSFGYRSLGVDDSLVVAEGILRLGKSERTRVLGKCRELQDLRLKKQPVAKASGGCFFRNPAGNKTAGQLIEEAGLKGLSIGYAQVSEVHANFIINQGGARAADIIDLMNIVRRKVEEKSSVNLDPEVKFIGY
ncbi:MAG: UDP-N-acetylmuramate dehydrogenase [Thermodesulfobacteriota bacterium]